jgi:hypothetical protein
MQNSPTTTGTPLRRTERTALLDNLIRQLSRAADHEIALGHHVVGERLAWLAHDIRQKAAAA